MPFQPDMVNGAFEATGAIMVLKSAYKTWQAKGYTGVYMPATLFFWAWGMWNLYYYPSLGQFWSFAGGVAICVGNFTWLALMLRFGEKRGIRG